MQLVARLALVIVTRGTLAFLVTCVIRYSQPVDACISLAHKLVSSSIIFSMFGAAHCER